MLFELEKSKFNFQIVTNLMQIQFSMKYHSLIYMIVCNLSWHWKLIHIYFADIMVNKCAAVTCKSGYASNNGKSITKFNYPMPLLKFTSVKTFTDHLINKVSSKRLDRIVWIKLGEHIP